jgi:hypothetical protein
MFLAHAAIRIIRMVASSSALRHVLQSTHHNPAWIVKTNVDLLIAILHAQKSSRGCNLWRPIKQGSVISWTTTMRYGVMPETKDFCFTS